MVNLCMFCQIVNVHSHTHTLSPPPQAPITDFISEPDKKVKIKLCIEHWRKKHKEKGTIGLPEIFRGSPPTCLKKFPTYPISLSS